MDNLGDVDWKANAADRAQSYAEYAYLSQQRVREMLNGEFGNGFTDEETDYAMEQLADFDWNVNALSNAKTLRDDMGYSEDEIRETLASDVYAFTSEQVDYAMAHIDD